MIIILRFGMFLLWMFARTLNVLTWALLVYSVSSVKCWDSTITSRSSCLIISQKITVVVFRESLNALWSVQCIKYVPCLLGTCWLRRTLAYFWRWAVLLLLAAECYHSFFVCRSPCWMERGALMWTSSSSSFAGVCAARPCYTTAKSNMKSFMNVNRGSLVLVCLVSCERCGKDSKVLVMQGNIFNTVKLT